MSNQKKRRRSAEWCPQGNGRLNDTSAVAILDAVGRQLIPPDLDELAMIRGINLCVQWYREAREFSTNKGVADRNRRREIMYKKAKALHQLLERDDSWLPIGAAPSYSDAFRLAMKRLVETIDRAIKQDSKPDGAIKAYQDSFKTRSPFEWLVGYYLPDVFTLLSIAPTNEPKDFFSRKSPYIRFVQSIITELRIGVDGHPYSLDTTVRAVRGRFDGRVRRKHTASDHYSFWRNALLRKAMGLPPGPIPKEPQPGFYAV